MVHHQIPPPLCPWHIHPWRLVSLFSCGLQSHYITYLAGDVLSLWIWVTVMTSMMPLTPNSYHFHTCNQRMGMEIEEMVAPGLIYVNCGSNPLGDGRLIADGLNWHLWGCPFRGNLPDGQIWMVVGLTDSHMDALGLSSLSSIILWPRQSPADPPELLRGLQLDRLVYQPKCPPCKHECGIPGFAQTEALSQRVSPIEKDCPTWACHHGLGEACSGITKQILH